VSFQVGPDGQPSRFDGNAYVSQDGRYWWNGAVWQQFKVSRGPSLFFIGLLAIVVAIVVFIVATKLTQPWEGEGVSNTKIDSRTRIEFDYHRSSTCSNLTFSYKFFDSSGKQVDVFSDMKSSRVEGSSNRLFSTTYHFTIDLDPQQPMNPSAARFAVDNYCHD
jgi:hypothetical protein